MDGIIWMIMDNNVAYIRIVVDNNNVDTMGLYYECSGLYNTGILQHHDNLGLALTEHQPFFVGSITLEP